MSLVSLATESLMLKELDVSVELLVNIGTLKIVKKAANTEAV